jgi:hypothetical protein
MAAVDEIDVTKLCAASEAEPIRTELKAVFWLWYRKHYYVVVLTVGWWIVRKDICVSDMRKLFVMLFGDEP